MRPKKSIRAPPYARVRIHFLRFYCRAASKIGVDFALGRRGMSACEEASGHQESLHKSVPQASSSSEDQHYILLVEDDAVRRMRRWWWLLVVLNFLFVARRSL
jgi:hypothetical protein